MNMAHADPARLEQAMAHLRAGRLSEAEQGLAMLPADTLPLSVLCARAELHLRAGRVDAAKADLETARARAPADPRVIDAAAALAMTVGQFPVATRLLEKALEQAPARPRLWYRLGVVCHAAGAYQRALDAYERALTLAPENVEPRVGRASVWQIQGRFEQSRAELENVLTLAPGHVEALTALAAQYEVRGQPRHGLALLEPLMPTAASGPAEGHTAEMALVYARLLRRVGRADAARVVLESMAGKPLTAHQRARLLFARADLHHDAGEFDAAFEGYCRANAVLPGGFDSEQHRRRVSAIQQTWTRAALQNLQGAGTESDAPVFIVGMPRSGTSLVERILSRHQAINAGGESTGIGDIERRLRGAGQTPDQDQITARIPAQQWRDEARSYLASLGAVSPLRVTDKMPANFLHLGLIQVLFPKARIIHVRRQPLDVALSCFRQDFSAPGLAWSRRLSDIAAYYSDYRRLMKHWRATLDLGLFDLDYESLVAEPENTVRALLDFVGLDWDPACLADAPSVTAARAADAEAITATASYEQVSRPIYTSAVGRNKDYAQHLAPLVKWFEQVEDDR